MRYLSIFALQYLSYRLLIFTSTKPVRLLSQVETGKAARDIQSPYEKEC
jgi:hypothetical protein